MIKSIFKNFYEDMLSCKVSLLHPWLYALIMSLTRFRVKSHSIVASMSRNSLLKTGAISEVKVTEWDLNPQQTNTRTNWTRTGLELDSKWIRTNTQPFSLTGQIIELCCEYLSVRCIWLYVLIISSKHFRVNVKTKAKKTKKLDNTLLNIHLI